MGDFLHMGEQEPFAVQAYIHPGRLGLVCRHVRRSMEADDQRWVFMVLPGCQHMAYWGPALSGSTLDGVMKMLHSTPPH